MEQAPANTPQIHPAEWVQRAACNGADRDQFYVSKRGRSNGDPLNLRERYCNDCEVVDLCLSEAVARKDVSVTVVGGTTREERKRLIRAEQEARGTARPRDKPAVDSERIRAFWERTLARDPGLLA